MDKKELLKQKVFDAVDACGAWVREYTDDVGANAELGFHETRTSAKLAEKLESLGLNVKKNIALTGLRTDIGSKPGPKVALIGELDGIVCRNHPQANPVDGASHSCGHNLQTSIVLTAAAAPNDGGLIDVDEALVAVVRERGE